MPTKSWMFGSLATRGRGRAATYFHFRYRPELTSAEQPRTEISRPALHSSTMPVAQQTVVGLIIFLMMYLYNDRFRLYAYTSTTSHFYLFMVVFACLVGSICLLLSCLFSLSTASIIAKTLYVSKLLWNPRVP
ncbi:hypothetical protein J6590_105313 [Homalodisca vitripennis]|nr:hypothetical protein J6590_105313 [Homalodisca vitripennis]